MLMISEGYDWVMSGWLMFSTVLSLNWSGGTYNTNVGNDIRRTCNSISPLYVCMYWQSTISV